MYQHATELYGLIHARYITTPEGLAIMRERYLAGRFGNCPRVMCEKQNVLPIAISEDLKIARVKVYCPRCKDIYSPKKKSADADGAYFGTSFPHLLLMVIFNLARPIPTSSLTSNARSSCPKSSGLSSSPTPKPTPKRSPRKNPKKSPKSQTLSCPASPCCRTRQRTPKVNCGLRLPRRRTRRSVDSEAIPAFL